MRYVSIALKSGEFDCPECGRRVRAGDTAAQVNEFSDLCCSGGCAHEADYREWSDTDAGEAELAALAAVDDYVRRAA